MIHVEIHHQGLWPCLETSLVRVALSVSKYGAVRCSEVSTERKDLAPEF